MASTNLGCHLTFILQIYKSRATPDSSAWDNSMSNIGAVNQAPGAVNHSPAATTLIGQKPNPWFNVLAAVVIVAGFGIVSLLPVELILQVGSGAGFAMVFALLISAIMWNVGTWYFGLPASSSHTLIGSIMGVGITNALLRGRDGTSGVDWSKATEIGQ